MTIYAESSAILAWLLGEKRGQAVRAILARAEAVVASDLTLIECDRVMIRAVTLNEITEKQAALRRARMNSAAAHWHILRIVPEVVDRARRHFPAEPVRTLDAIHLSSAALVGSAATDFAILSLDERIRKNAVDLGFAVQPE
jgi:predicted nucleic acid-binding protein